MADQSDRRGWTPHPPLFVVVIACVGVALMVLGVVADFRGPSDAEVDCFDRGIVGLELAGDHPRFVSVLADCEPIAHDELVEGVRSALLADLFVIGFYVLVGAVACTLLPWGYRVRRLRDSGPMMVGAVAAIGVLDLIENAFLWFAIDHPERSKLIVAATAASWGKWLVAVVVVLYATGGAIGVLARASSAVGRVIRTAVSGDAPAAPAAGAPAAGVGAAAPDGADGPLEALAVAATGPDVRRGLALSGGGIRSASYCLGALQVLDAPDASGSSVYATSDVMTAVSGGGYVAGAWKVSRSG